MNNPKTTVYVKVSPKECYARVRRRAREVETDVNIFYVQGLEKRHTLEMHARIDSGLELIEVSVENTTPRELADVVCKRLQSERKTSWRYL
mmetsp:Transcript_3013/g.6882  ORF Transcript_3013/g.6882 Transcript_3013/m.6882 type:complete len:91 (+) Transcript_3013:338-610(+)